MPSGPNDVLCAGLLQVVGGRGGHVEGGEFAALLDREFKPKTDEAKSAVEQAVLTLAQQALANTKLIGSDVIVSIASPSISIGCTTRAISSSPSSFRRIDWCPRSNSGRPTKASSDWILRLKAGDDRESSSAAALIDPRRATWTKASMAAREGRRRMTSSYRTIA